MNEWQPYRRYAMVRIHRKPLIWFEDGQWVRLGLTPVAGRASEWWLTPLWPQLPNPLTSDPGRDRL